MKYGKILEYNIEENHKDYYIDYNYIKKYITINPLEFINLLSINIDKVETFYNKNKNKNKLLNYCLLNLFSILKITKKYNKRNNINITNRIQDIFIDKYFYKDLLNTDIIHQNNQENNKVCYICYDKENYIVTLECQHIICWNCLLRCYLNNYNNCCYCRKKLNTNPILIYLENLTKSKCNPLYDQILNKNKKCLFIGIDGLRPDCLLFANTPNIDRIIKRGTINFETETITETYSGPSWCSILSGKDQNETEIFSNDIVAAIASLKGDVKMREDQREKYSSAYKGQMIKSGNWIKTSDGVFVSLIFLSSI